MGKRIGKYEVGKTIGSGNFSKVKQAIDTETGQSWALKIIDKEQLQKDHMEEQLKREIALMKQLKHENIVQLREVMQTQHHIYLVLELVTGGELFDKIVAAKRLDEGIARRYFQQLVCAVLCCHRNGIAHRDIKPENLLLDSNDNIKISDFGLSNLQPTGGKDLLQTVCGTPNYVAPEVLKERGYNGFLADAWSCGIVLFVMLAGYLPFDDENVNALFNKIERGDFRMARHFSAQAADLIGKLLLVDPTRRLTIEQVTQHPWFLVGFDQAKIDGLKLIGQPTDEAVGDAIKDTALTETADPPKAATGAAPAAGRPSSGPGSLDGFDVIGRLTACTLFPLSSTEANLHKSTSRWLVAATLEEILQLLQPLKVNMRLIAPGEAKGFANMPKGLLTFTASASPTVLPGVSLFEFKRGRGDVFEFHGLCQLIQGSLDSSDPQKSKLRSRLVDDGPSPASP
mgnify:CR=1 FL=1